MEEISLRLAAAYFQKGDERANRQACDSLEDFLKREANARKIAGMAGYDAANAAIREIREESDPSKRSRRRTL